jgi:hypothetical protein
MKKVFRVLAIATFLLITSTVPSFADGNPWPICTPAGVCSVPQ